MKIELTPHPAASKLIMLFAGWGMDSTPFKHLRRPGYDIAILWDYRSLELDITPLQRYSEICVVAWSFGVAAAHSFMELNPTLPYTLRIAVNGTLAPVNDTTGIPRQIFEGTLQGLNDASLLKFYRRMCGSGARFARFRNTLPHRPIAELADELRAIDSLPHRRHDTAMWQRVIVGSRDLIIPTANQLNAWHHHPALTVTDEAHLPNFEQIIDRYIYDKALIESRFSHSADTYNSEAHIQQSMARQLTRLITEHITIPPVDALEVGSGTGIFTRMITQACGSQCRWTLWDLAHIDPTLPGTHITCDAEEAIAKAPHSSYNLIASSATIQWFNSPISFVEHALRALRPRGLLAISTFGERNFNEIAPYTRALPYLSADAWRQTLSAIPGIEAEVSTDIVTRQFATPIELLRHMKLTGVNACLTQAPQALNAAKRIIDARVSTLTYHTIYIIVRKK